MAQIDTEVIRSQLRENLVQLDQQRISLEKQQTEIQSKLKFLDEVERFDWAVQADGDRQSNGAHQNGDLEARVTEIFERHSGPLTVEEVRQELHRESAHSPAFGTVDSEALRALLCQLDTQGKLQVIAGRNGLQFQRA